MWVDSAYCTFACSVGCKEAYLKIARISQPPAPNTASRNVNNNMSIGMVKAKSGPRSLQSRSCLVLFETDSGSNVRVLRQGRDRSSLSIQVAGDTQLLQVFEHRGHWQHKLQFGCRDAQPAEGGSPVQSTPRAKSAKRPAALVFRDSF